MNLKKTIQWQWEGYAKYHQDKVNLLIHIFAVALFWLAAITLIVGAARVSIISVILAIVALFISLVLQGIGHKKEINPTVPFASKSDFIKRFLCEQFINFPRFVLTGGWFNNFSGK